MSRLSGRRFLVIRYRKLGDTLMATPVIRSLVAEGAEVYTIGERPWADIFSSLPGVKGHRSVSTGHPSYWECLRIGWAARKWKCDTAIVLRFSGGAAVIARAAGCRSRVGAVKNNRPLPWKLTRNVYGATQSLPHQVDKYYAVADAATGIDLPRVPTLYVPQGGAPDLPVTFVTVHLGNGGSNLSWSPERWAILVARMKEAGWSVVVTGDAKERGAHGQAIARGDVDLVGTNLDTLAGIFARSAAVVALDGGGSRLATAVGTPVVSLSIGFTWSRSAITPWMAPGEVVEPREHCPQCSLGKCMRTGTTCRDTLSVDQVFEALQRLMASAQARHPHTAS